MSEATPAADNVEELAAGATGDPAEDASGADAAASLPASQVLLTGAGDVFAVAEQTTEAEEERQEQQDELDEEEEDVVFQGRSESGNDDDDDDSDDDVRVRVPTHARTHATVHDSVHSIPLRRDTERRDAAAAIDGDDNDEVSLENLQRFNREDSSPAGPAAASGVASRLPGGPSLTEADLYAMFPERREQITMLLGLFNKAFMTHAVFIHGLPSTGKSSVLRALLRCPSVADRRHQAYVSCLECSTPRLLFTQLLSQLALPATAVAVTATAAAGRPRVECGSLDRFVEQLRHVTDPDAPTYLVFDRAERLLEMDALLWPALCSLEELVHPFIRVVFVSWLSPQVFKRDGGSRFPMVIYFPAYSDEQLVDILERMWRKLFPEPPKLQVHQRPFLERIVEHFTLSRDIADLRNVAKELYPKYIEPARRFPGPLPQRELYNEFKSLLKTDVLQKVHLRQVTGKDILAGNAFMPFVLKETTELQLPDDAKLLLLAGYLASRNSAKSDKRLFSQINTNAVRPRQEAKAGEASVQRAFELSRLLAIYWSISERHGSRRLECKAFTRQQINVLISMKLLAPASPYGSLDAPKLRCLLSPEAAEKIAYSVNLQLSQYIEARPTK